MDQPSWLYQTPSLSAGSQQAAPTAQPMSMPSPAPQWGQPFGSGYQMDPGVGSPPSNWQNTLRQFFTTGIRPAVTTPPPQTSGSNMYEGSGYDEMIRQARNGTLPTGMPITSEERNRGPLGLAPNPFTNQGDMSDFPARIQNQMLQNRFPSDPWSNAGGVPERQANITQVQPNQQMGGLMRMLQALLGGRGR